MAANVLSSVSGGDTSINSPRRSPWTQVLVKGAESEQSVVIGARVSEQMTNSIDCVKDASIVSNEVDNSNAGGVKQVWGKPLKGNGSAVAVAAVSASADEVSPVMDTYSWPALSKDPPPKSSSSSSDSLAEASLLASQGSGLGSLSSNKQAIANTSSPTSTPNHVTNTRQKSMRRGSNNGGFVQPSSPQPRAPAVELPLGKPGNTTGDSFSNKEGGPKGGFGNDHQPQRSNSFNRWGSGGQHQRGDGSYHHQSFGGRRDQDRGNQDWSTHRSYGSRENHMQQQQRGAPRGYPRAPHGPPFLTPLPVGPYPGHMGYPTDIPPVILYPTPELLRGVGPLMPPVAAHHMYSPSIPDQQLYSKIMNQIEYYFSNENLVKDTFLRRNMDEQGWVSIKLIAGFKKVQNLAVSIKQILDALQASTVVEVQNDKIRKRNEWMKWILAPGAFSPVLSPQARAKSGHDMLAGQFQGVTLDEMSVHGHTEVLKKSPPQPGGEGDVQTSFEPNTSAGSTSK